MDPNRCTTHGRDLTGEQIGIIVNDMDDQGGAAGITCQRAAYYYGHQIHSVFRNTPVRLNDDAVIGFNDQNVVHMPNGDREHARVLVAEAAARGADAVERILSEGKFALSLGGNHLRGLDVIGALRYCHEHGIEMGIVWTDAHPDLNTEDTTLSDHDHGKIAAVLMGRGRQELLELFKEAPFLKPENFIYIGLNEIDELPGKKGSERDTLEELKKKGMRAFEMKDVRNPDNPDVMPQAVLDAISDLVRRLDTKGGRLWLELDMDVFTHEDGEMQGAVMESSGEMRVKQGEDLFRHIGSITKPLGMGVSELAPDKDPELKGSAVLARCVGLAMGVDEKPLPPERMFSVGMRLIERKPGHEYVPHSFECLVLKDGQVVEVKASSKLNPDFALGSKVRIHSRALERIGQHTGTVTYIARPNTEGRTNDIFRVEYGNGRWDWYQYGELALEPNGGGLAA